MWDVFRAHAARITPTDVQARFAHLSDLTKSVWKPAHANTKLHENARLFRFVQTYLTFSSCATAYSRLPKSSIGCEIWIRGFCSSRRSLVSLCWAWQLWLFVQEVSIKVYPSDWSGRWQSSASVGELLDVCRNLHTAFSASFRGLGISRVLAAHWIHITKASGS